MFIISMASEEQATGQQVLEEHKRTAHFESELHNDRDNLQIEVVPMDNSITADLCEESKDQVPESLRREPMLLGTP